MENIKNSYETNSSEQRPPADSGQYLQTFEEDMHEIADENQNVVINSDSDSS